MHRLIRTDGMTPLKTAAAGLLKDAALHYVEEDKLMEESRLLLLLKPCRFLHSERNMRRSRRRTLKRRKLTYLILLGPHREEFTAQYGLFRNSNLFAPKTALAVSQQLQDEERKTGL